MTLELDHHSRADNYRMPWLFKATIAMFIVSTLGAALIAFACVEGGWESITHFAWGLGITGVGLIGSILFSVTCAVTKPAWRKRSLVLSGLALLLLIGLFLFARLA